MEQVNSRLDTFSIGEVRRKPFAERAVLEIIGKLTRGHLQLTLPDGTDLTVGDPASPFRATMQIVRPEFFTKTMWYGDIGFAESYLDGDWETDNLTAVLQVMLLNLEDLAVMSGSRRRFLPVNLLRSVNRLVHRVRANSVSGSRKNISAHYDLSNEFFALFLDPTMTYSGAVFAKPGQSLEEAQTEKYDRLCRKLNLQPADHVLEIGSGWGGFAVHAARTYGCRVTTVTISQEQYAHARQRFEREGLSGQIEILLKDYRLLEGSYDKIVSIEMLEAVGHTFLPAYFSQIHRLLKKQGIAAFQVITSPDARYAQFRKGVDFIQKHIFPGSLLPSIGALNAAVNATGDLHLYHLEEFGLSYARTLAHWKKSFNERLDTVRALGFDGSFIRKWNYYLSYCEAGFAMRNINVVQMVYARPNNLKV
jgi:cyclopropane-fatty-acyl-phospholipid synthase